MGYKKRQEEFEEDYEEYVKKQPLRSLEHLPKNVNPKPTGAGGKESIQNA